MVSQMETGKYPIPAKERVIVQDVTNPSVREGLEEIFALSDEELREALESAAPRGPYGV